jgi:hypothetical protein
LILVATKSDLRQKQIPEPISMIQRQLKQSEIGALEHFECSSLRYHNVTRILGAGLTVANAAERTRCIIQ